MKSCCLCTSECVCEKRLPEHVCLAQIRRVDTEILTAVRQQSSSGSRARWAAQRIIPCRHAAPWARLRPQAPHDPPQPRPLTQVLLRRQDLGAAKAAIEELFGKIGEIRRKAEASEVMVQEICRDIRKLDHAKTHLTHTITALRRLAMLVNAVGAPTRPTAYLVTLPVSLCQLSRLLSTCTSCHCFAAAVPCASGGARRSEPLDVSTATLPCLLRTGRAQRRLP